MVFLDQIVCDSEFSRLTRNYPSEMQKHPSSNKKPKKNLNEKREHFGVLTAVS